jgi:hypothetical protein
LETEKAQGQIQPYRKKKKIPQSAMGKIGFGHASEARGKNENYFIAQKSKSLRQVHKNAGQEKVR